MLAELREIEEGGAIEPARRVRQRISAEFAYGTARMIVQADTAEKLGTVLQPLRKRRQPAITDLVALRRTINTVEERLTGGSDPNARARPPPRCTPILPGQA